MSKVLEQVAQLASTDDDEVDNLPLSELCRLHDALMQATEERRIQIDDPSASGGGTIKKNLVQWQVSSSDVSLDDVAREADWYRAVLFLSVLAYSRWPASLPDSVKDGLTRTIRQSELLLEILEGTYRLCYGGTTKLPSNFPVLKHWLDSRDDMFGESSSNLMSSLDRRDLEEEEDILLRMAYTPIPAENRQRVVVQDDPNDILLEATVDVSNFDYSIEGGTMRVQFDPHRGVLRSMDDSSSSTDGWWAAITALSETRYESPLQNQSPSSFIITNVIIQDVMKSRRLVDSLDLHLKLEPSAVSIWSTSITAVVEQLKELGSLYKQINSL